MEFTDINLFDAGVGLVLLLSAVIAFLRGMVREVLKIGAWILAGMAAFHGFGYARPWVRETITAEWLADGVTMVGLFLIAIIPLSLLAGLIADRIRQTGFSALDRTLGFLFGLLRGAIVVCLAYLVVTWTIEADSLPDALLEARSRPMIEDGAVLLATLAPETLREETAEALARARQRARQAIDLEGQLRDLTSPPATRGADGADTPEGYDEATRDALDRLIEGNR